MDRPTGPSATRRVLRFWGWAGLSLTSIAVLALTLVACSQPAPTPLPTRTPFPAFSAPVAPPAATAATQAAPAPALGAPNESITLQTAITEHSLAFTGVGDGIDGKMNPTLRVPLGATVQITLKNGDGAIHTVGIPDFNVTSSEVGSKGATATVTFKAARAGQFPYFCTIPGHRQVGMEGLLVVGDQVAAQQVASVSIARDPTDLPGPIGNRPPQAVQVNLVPQEVEGRLADGASFSYWTFNGKVPGPFARVRIGDTVTVNVNNPKTSTMSHSVDLHAVTGPGGGGSITQVAPVETKSFTFKAIKAGIYVYHCATPMVAEHISNGMYGIILVEPEGGLPKVDREFYVMQGEIYTKQAFGTKGHLDVSIDKLMNQTPEYYVLNGAVGALASEHPLTAKQGETVRIFFGVGGPNATSSFHVIGEIFDRVYNQGSLTSQPATDVQTTVVPPGAATAVEFKVEVPGRYVLVDHALTRLERGLAGFLIVEGTDQPDLYRQGS